MLTAICRLLGLARPCAPECAAAALGNVIHERLAIELTYRRAWGDKNWRASVRTDMEIRAACRAEREI